jgi:hypothetical protein
VTFGGATEFDGVTFAFDSGKPPFRGTQVLEPSAQHAWPEGWYIVPNQRGEYLVARDKSVSQPTVPRADP